VGMAEMQITIWVHRPVFRCLAVFDVGGLQVSL